MWGRWDECRWDILVGKDELTALCDTAAASLLVLLLLLAMGTTVYIFNRDLSNARGKGGEGNVKFLILHSACPYQTLVFSLQIRHGNKPFSPPRAHRPSAHTFPCTTDTLGAMYRGQ